MPDGLNGHPWTPTDRIEPFVKVCPSLSVTEPFDGLDQKEQTQATSLLKQSTNSHGPSFPPQNSSVTPCHLLCSTDIPGPLGQEQMASVPQEAPGVYYDQEIRILHIGAQPPDLTAS